MATLLHVVDDTGYRKLTGLDQAADVLAAPNTTVWIDSDERTDALEKLLLDTLGIHPLAVEDIFSDRLTPKIEDYGSFLYIVMHGVRRDGEDPESLGTAEIDVVIGPHWVFTHHSSASRSISAVQDELARNPRALRRGPAYLAHAVIDHLTDFYLPVVDRFQEDIDDLEKHVVENPTPDLLQHMFGLKRSLQRLRRLSVYQRDALQRLSRGEFDLIPERALPFYRDVYDQFVRVSDLADSYRELVGSALDIYMSVTANRTNDIMKVLALISTIMLPLTFIAGLYGMNFDHMPELHTRYGYPMALGLMVVVAIALMIWFRRRKWL
jgi:magnesium transporter